MFTIADILDIAIQIEENGEAYYRKALASVTDPDLADMFQWLAEQEAEHARWFADMRSRVQATVEDPQVAGMGRALLREAVSEKGFSLDDAGESDLKRVQTLLALSISFEQDTAMFYELLRPFVMEDPDRRQLDEIIAQEKKHVEELKAFLCADGATEQENVKMS